MITETWWSTKTHVFFTAMLIDLFESLQQEMYHALAPGAPDLHKFQFLPHYFLVTWCFSCLQSCYIAFTQVALQYTLGCHKPL